MFIHNLKYTIKSLLKNRTLIFWTFAFSIILSTFFYMAFSNIENDEKLQIFDIAVIDNDGFEKQEIYKETLKKLSEESDKKLFNIKYVGKEEAEDLLEKSGVVVVPGDAFGKYGQGFFRISYVCSDEKLQEVIDRMKADGFKY